MVRNIGVEWWEQFRRPNGTLDLVKAYIDLYDHSYIATHYLEKIQDLMPIRSRQAAAVAIENAKEISNARDRIG